MIRVYIMFKNGSEITFLCQAINISQSQETGALTGIQIKGLDVSLSNVNPLYINMSEVICIRTTQLTPVIQEENETEEIS